MFGWGVESLVEGELTEAAEEDVPTPVEARLDRSIRDILRDGNVEGPFEGEFVDVIESIPYFFSLEVCSLSFAVLSPLGIPSIPLFLFLLLFALLVFVFAVWLLVLLFG